MLGEGVFPFDLIKKGSEVVIYGIGNYGKSYIEQIEQTKFCKVVAISDRNKTRKCVEYDYVESSYLVNIKFDYVVIAVKSLEVATDIYWHLVGLGIDREKIVSEYMNHKYFFPCYIPDWIESLEYSNKDLVIAITLDGGLGDCVVSLALYRKIVELAPNAIIDIYGKRCFIKSIYRNEKNIRCIYEFDAGRCDVNRFNFDYDLAIRYLFFIQVEFVDYCSLRNKSKKLFDKIRDTKANPLISDLKYVDSSYIFVHRRAEQMGFDRFRFLGLGDVWNINGDDSKLVVGEEYKNEFKTLGLHKYITFNCGASTVPGQESRMQTKVWPIEYYQLLIGKFKEKHPNIKVVQLGDRNAVKIKCADDIFINSNLEMVKHILYNSLLHIDCEGGLVHMATQLGTKCVVLFGPTPTWFYGYTHNENIVSPVCGNCCHIRFDWYTKCLLGDNEPRCMKAIKPSDVIKVIDKCMGNEFVELEREGI